MPNIDVDYPIRSQICIKASLKPSLKPIKKKDPWVYLRAPKCDLFEFADPVSEIMVVYLSGFVAPLFGWKTLLVREEFPDSLFEDIGTGERIRVEFESYSSNFLDHKHSPFECDLIICWQDNMSTADKSRYLFSKNSKLRLLELKKLFHHYDFFITSEGKD